MSATVNSDHVHDWRVIDYSGNERCQCGGVRGPVLSASRTTAQLSSAERSKVNDALIAQVGALTKQVNELTAAVSELRACTKDLRYDATTDQWVLMSGAIGMQRLWEVVDGLATFDREQDRRIDAIERGAAVLSAWVRRPWWERVRSRLGF